MKKRDSKLYALFERTVKNCIYYERQHDLIHFWTEIHCLRGIYYCLEDRGILDEEDLELFNSFIEFSNLAFENFEQYIQFLNMDFDLGNDGD